MAVLLAGEIDSKIQLHPNLAEFRMHRRNGTMKNEKGVRTTTSSIDLDCQRKTVKSTNVSRRNRHEPRRCETFVRAWILCCERHAN